MEELFVEALFYILAGMGVILFIVLLIRILRGKEEIDKIAVTWLIVAFLCVVFPIVGNISIEYGDLKMSLTKLSCDSKEVETQLKSLEEENLQMNQQIDELGTIITESKRTLINDRIPSAQKIEILERVQNEINTLSNQSLNVSRRLESASVRNKSLVEDLENSKRKIR